MLEFKDLRWTPLSEETVVDKINGRVTYINNSSHVIIKLTDYSGKDHFLTVTKQYATDFANALLDHVKDM